MYTIELDGVGMLYDPSLPVEMNIREPKAHLALNEPGYLNFTIDKEHPRNSNLHELSMLTLYEDGEIIYVGRVIREVYNFDGSRNIETEGVLATLNDSYIEPFEFSSMEATAVQSFMHRIINAHNQQGHGGYAIDVGEVTVRSSGLFARSSDKFLNSWEVLKSRLLESSLGGYFVPRYEDNATYLNYYDELPEDNTQHIEFGKNMLDYISDIDSSGMHTAVLPVGKNGHTIENYPDGDTPFVGVEKSGYLVYKESLEALYGKRITKIVNFDDLETDLSLVIRASVNLRDIYNNREITVRAIDLHLTHKAIESFRIGKNVIVESAPHGISESFPLVSLDIDISNPANTEITIGKITKSLTDRMRKE